MNALPPSPRLVVENLRCGFFPGRPVIHSLSLEAAGGEIIGLVGPNGSGKSTLLRCLTNWLPATSGKILIDGREVGAMPSRDRARAIGMLVQNPEHPVPMPVREFISLGYFSRRGWFGGESPLDRDAVDRTMQRFGLDLKAGVNCRVDQLSGGEFQRVRLAQIHLQDPSILLLDEPTSFLDWPFQSMLIRFVREKARQEKRLVVMAIHDLNIAMALCDRVLMLRDGSVLADGPPKDVLREDLLQKVFGHPPAIHTISHFPGRFFSTPGLAEGEGS